ncbi:MAG: hypothetical protein C7B44_11410 [Sulfobacillus thermosulfidooxidans]|uniref:Flagellar hook-associated protein 2 n=1 Tax=Sulfobacillus thermotolerans TaxID=338644 RepID=A0ABM6RV06_9FIRM|nr:flagellar filament capping protein FliD [Sulfobacillus sp. hq2]AUW95057.1 hypothetical protein BXT84_14745 [Sulfobacillus thermotolerans]POB10341.1 hypothetical protein CO251_10340 [Sulfobacillus sp. hq2]PSR35980.1 MAG: hypothetical protein C7B44_11410 [Sulfobacillus thermosulfidooxidans]
MSGIAVNWTAVYGTNNVAAQMLSDLSLNEMESMAIEPLTQQLNTLEQQLTALQNNSAAWTTLQGDAAAFQSGLNSLGSSTALQAMEAVSSNTAVATAAADGNAPPGTYAIDVSQLATSEIDGYASTAMTITDPTAALGLAATTVAFSIGGVSVSIAVTSTTTLDQLVTDINQSGAPVQAQAAQSGSDYYLKLYGTVTDQAISYTGGSAALASVGILTSTSSGYTVNSVQVAEPAVVQFQGATVQNTTNLFTNLIPDVTVQLASTGTTDVTVSANYSQDAQSIQAVFNDFNTWSKDTWNLAYATEQGPAASVSSSTASSYQTNPNQVIHSPVPMNELNQVTQQLASFQDSQGLSLGSLGITYNAQTATFSVNMTTLTSALQNNLAGVQSFFQQMAQSPPGIVQGLAGFSGSGSLSVAGTAITSDTNQESQTNEQITQLQSEIQQAIAAAQTQYDSFVSTLSAMAETENAFSAYAQQTNGQNGTLA